MDGSGSQPPAGSPPRHPLEELLQMGLRATFGAMQAAQPQQAGAAPTPRVLIMPQMPQIFAQLGGQAPQWEAFVREAMDAQGGGDRPHPASEQAIRDLRKGTARVQDGGKCCCSAAPGADELAEGCSVCQDDFAEGDEWIQMPCKHFFHGDCLMPWLKEHNTCPTCRATVAEKEPAQDTPRPAASTSDPPPVQAAAGADGPHGDGQEQLLPDALAGQPPTPFGFFPPGMFGQPQPGGDAAAVHAAWLQQAQQAQQMHGQMQQHAQQMQQQAQQMQQMQQQQAQQQWEQWISRLDQASAPRDGANAGPRMPHGIDLRQLFGGLRNENVMHARAEEERQLQEAIAASMAEERQRAATERHDRYTEDDLCRLSVRELKQFLDERSVDYSHCVEKSELLAEASRALRERGAETGAAREADAAREAAELEEAIRLSLLDAEGAGGGL